MLSVAKNQRRNAWRYYVRGVAFGDGRRPAGQSLKDAQELAGLLLGRWLGRGLRALGLTEGTEVSERQLELLFGEGRHPDADRIERGLLDDATVRRVIERAHERAVATALRWLEDEVAETRWASGRGRAKTPALVVAAFRHYDNRDGLPCMSTA